MTRNTKKLVDHEFDVIIVGGGIFGACAAWHSSRRGMSTALVERGDFCGETSANSLKIVHGGIRYLQHGDISRLRCSSKERNMLFRLAPHLVHPLPVIVPTYGHGKSGKMILRTGMILYDLLTVDRNRGIRTPERKISRTKSLSRHEILKMFPCLPNQRLTGGALFYDAIVIHPPRLVLGFIQSAAQLGAHIANYVEAESFLKKKNQVTGIEACDVITGQRLSIRAKFVLNTAGPWTKSLLEKNGLSSPRSVPYSRDVCFVVDRPSTVSAALAVQGMTKDPDAIMCRDARHLFVVPWKGKTLVGVWHKVHEPGSEKLQVSSDEIDQFLTEINSSYPALNLHAGDILKIHAGLVPFGKNSPGAVNLSYGKRSICIDHEKTDGVKGLLSLIGIRFTMGHRDSEIAVKTLIRKLGRKDREPAFSPVDGGDMEARSPSEIHSSEEGLNHNQAIALWHLYGSRMEEVVSLAKEDENWSRNEEEALLKAQTLHAVRHEMALKLSDVIFRRAGLCFEKPEEKTLFACAQVMKNELGWSEMKRQREMDEVLSQFAGGEIR